MSVNNVNGKPIIYLFGKQNQKAICPFAIIAIFIETRGFSVCVCMCVFCAGKFTEIGFLFPFADFQHLPKDLYRSLFFFYIYFTVFSIGGNGRLGVGHVFEMWY